MKKRYKKKFATTWDRTKDLSVNSRPLCQRSSGGIIRFDLLSNRHASCAGGVVIAYVLQNQGRGPGLNPVRRILFFCPSEKKKKKLLGKKKKKKLFTLDQKNDLSDFFFFSRGLSIVGLLFLLHIKHHYQMLGVQYLNSIRKSWLDLDACSAAQVHNPPGHRLMVGVSGLHAGVSHLHRVLVIRSYHGESTASHPNCEVKHRWARSVLW